MRKTRWVRYTVGVPDDSGPRDGAPRKSAPTSSAPTGDRASLRTEHVAQTRAALVSAGRLLFGARGFAGTSVEDIAREARVTTGALYHHFPTKAAVFEAVFEQVHADMMGATAAAVSGLTSPVDVIMAGIGTFLDAALEPEVQRIIIIDAPAVLGVARFTELDERYAVAATVAALEAAVATGELRVEDPLTLARLLFGALDRAGLLIASAADPQAARDAAAATLRALLDGLRR